MHRVLLGASPSEDGRFPYYVTRQVNRRGVLVVREAVPVDTVLRWRDDLMVCPPTD